jgi:hypothetical protein
MEDNQLAQLLLFTSIDEDILELEFRPQERTTEVEELLRIFDQGRIHRHRHFLEIDEAGVPKRYRPILRRLQQTVAEPEVAEAMELEDEVKLIPARHRAAPHPCGGAPGSARGAA